MKQAPELIWMDRVLWVAVVTVTALFLYGLSGFL